MRREHATGTPPGPAGGRGPSDRLGTGLLAVAVHRGWQGRAAAVRLLAAILALAIPLVLTAPARAQARPAAIRRRLEPRPAAVPAPSDSTAWAAATVPAGARLDFVLPHTIRLHRAGQVIYAQLASPVYAGNRLALPAGTLARGRITRVRGPALWRRAQAALGGEFSSPPHVAVTFTALRLPRGRWAPIRTDVGLARPPLRFVASAQGAPRRPSWLRRGIRYATGRVRDLGHFLWQQRHWHVLRQEAIQSLPYHPADLPAGTAYAARLRTPLRVADAGPAPLPVAGTPRLPPGLILHARLLRGVSSASAKWGAPVIAVLDRPVLNRGGKLLIPQGSRLIGHVTLARPARRLGRNGRLRFTFSHLQFPNGGRRAVAARLQAAVSSGHLRIGPEGGVRATAPAAAPTLALAVLLNSTVQGDADNAWTLNAGSGTHLALWGTAMAALVSRARPLAMVLGYAGSGRTVYERFIARGHNVVFPAGTRLVIRLEPPPPKRPRLPLPPRGR